MNSTDANRLYTSLGPRHLATLDEYIMRCERHLASDTQTLNDLVCAVKFNASACGIRIRGGIAIQDAIKSLVELHQQGVKA